MEKRRLMKEYDATAPAYDMRYREEQELKIGFILSRVRPRGGVVLDAGCGTGMLLRKIMQSSFAIGIDMSIKMLEEAKRKGCSDLILADLEALPLVEGCCKTVYSISVLQLLGDPTEAIGELMRVLEPGGEFAISLLGKAEFARGIQISGAAYREDQSESLKDTFYTGHKKTAEGQGRGHITTTFYNKLNHRRSGV